MKKFIAIVCLVATMMCLLVGCTEAERVNYNIGISADNFNVTRRLAVINARTDTPMFELVGNFSLSNNSENELVITCEVQPGVYKKHFVYLNEWTLYVVEDISGAQVNQYMYEVNFLPQMFIPYTVTVED